MSFACIFFFGIWRVLREQGKEGNTGIMERRKGKGTRYWILGTTGDGSRWIHYDLDVFYEIYGFNDFNDL